MANAGGEFNRVDRSGDSMEGSLTYEVRTALAYSWYAIFTGDTGTAMIRCNGNDLEFWDTTHGVWKKLSDLTGATGLAFAILEEFVATPGQTLFVFGGGKTYPVGASVLNVFVNGQWVDHSLFTETAADRFTLGASVPGVPFFGGEKVTGVVFRGVPAPGTVFSVMVSGTDTTPMYLTSKVVAGTNVTKTILFAGANEQVQISAVDSKVKVNAGADTTEADLNSKIAAGTNITKTTLNAGFNEQLQISSVDSKAKVRTGSDTTEGDLDTKITVTNGVVKTITSGGGDERLQLSASAAALYTPSTPGDWAGAAPTTVQQALDRIAAALALHGGGPIA